MDRRWNILFIIPLLTALAAFFLTDQLVFTGVGFVVGYLILLGLRSYLLPPHVRKAISLFETGSLEAALAEANAAIAARPEGWEPYYMRALIHFSLSQLGAAEADARRAIELNPESDVNHVTLGQTLFAQARLDEAEEAFREAVRLRGREGLNQYHLGATLFRLDACEEAVPRLELATRLGIPNPQLTLLAYYYLGRCLDHEGEEEAASAAYGEMNKHREALEALKHDAYSVADYPALSLLQNDIAAIEKRLRPIS
ncbi:MAG TPA: tetratricopeptide repeat protein [Candidatus Binatia bacterium]|nr:tetratricopeptide repeat protein [Candidatus Binatia bacterium]